MKLIKIGLLLFSFSTMLFSCSLLSGGSHEKCSAYSQNFQDRDNAMFSNENLLIIEGNSVEGSI